MPSLIEFSLTPMVATAIFLIAVVSGYQYRRYWKDDGPWWRLWLSGLISAGCILILGFVPLEFT